MRPDRRARILRVCGPMVETALQVDEQRALEPADLDGVDGGDRTGVETEHRHRSRSAADRLTIKPRGQNRGLASAQLLEPAGGHESPCEAVIDQDHPRVSNRNIGVGGLDQLPSRSVPGVGNVGGQEFLDGPDVEDVERTVVLLRPPAIKRLAVDHGHSEAPRHLFGAFTPDPVAPGSRFRRRPILAVFKLEPGQMPPHCAVFQRENRVRHSGIDQGLGTDDAPGAPGAVDHDGRLRIRDRIMDPVHQFRARHVHPARNAHDPELVDRARVEHCDPGTSLLHLGQLARGDRRGAIGVFDELSERLAGHIQATEQFQSRSPPRVDAAFQHGDVRIPVARQTRLRPARPRLRRRRTARPGPTGAEWRRVPGFRACSAECCCTAGCACARKCLLPSDRSGRVPRTRRAVPECGGGYRRSHPVVSLVRSAPPSSAWIGTDRCWSSKARP